jgi:hypothetical protein
MVLKPPRGIIAEGGLIIACRKTHVTTSKERLSFEYPEGFSCTTLRTDDPLIEIPLETAFDLNA